MPSSPEPLDDTVAARDATMRSTTVRRATVLPSSAVLRDGRAVVESSQARFERVEPLGEGAAGLVELARDRDIDRLVAIKRLKDSSDPENVLRFTREVQALGRLEHPGIVPVHDVGIDEHGRYFLVMKHLVGDSLEAVIENLRAGDDTYRARFPLRERVRICDAVLRIVEFAHERGVLHRDLKPGNIMIGPHGEVTIVDWGLSKRLDDEELLPLGDVDAEPHDGRSPHRTRARVRMGTPLYMSPEQARGAVEQIGVESDLYTLGVVFYELLSLEHYLTGKTEIQSILEAIEHEPARFAFWNAREGQERMPIELAYWLRTAMSKPVADRFSSARAMREELQRIVDGKFAVVCPTTMTRRMFRVAMDAANRRPLVVFGLTAAALGLAAYGAIALLTGLVAG